jgi:Calcineurin-like phosphoesterase/Purple acid Phosphatase, N-terminal domain
MTPGMRFHPRTARWLAQLFAAASLLASVPALAHQPLAEDIARSNARISLADSPGHELLMRGELHLIAGNLVAARADLDLAAKLEPTLPGLELCRSALLLSEGKPDAALAMIDHHLEHEAGDLAAWKLRARIHEVQRQPRLAAADLARVIETGRHIGPDLYLEQARLLKEAGLPDQALASLRAGTQRLGPVVTLELAIADAEQLAGMSDAATARRERVTARMRVDALPTLATPRPASTPASGGAPPLLLADPVVTRGPFLQLATPTSIVLRWRTDVASTSRVRYGTAIGALTSTANQTASATEHEIQLTGLTPNTRYYYSIGTDVLDLEGNDAQHTFVTAPTPGTPQPTRVWILGDPGTGTSEQDRVRDAFLDWNGNRNIDVWLMLGDNAYDSGTDSEYQEGLFDPYEATLKNTVLWPTRGNHDGVRSGAANDYYEFFTMPTAGEAGGLASGTEAYYSFDHGNIHFICLDSEGTTRTATGAMATWLENDLAATTRDWIVAFWHHPPYTKGSHDSDNSGDSGGRMRDMRENLVPILEAAGVDLVLTGHSHSYERSFLLDGHYGISSTLTPAMKVDDGDGREDGDGAYTKASLGTGPHQGVVYTVAGSSGKRSGGSLNHPAMFYSVNALGSMVLDIVGNRMDAVFIDDVGAIRDHFTMVKGGGVTIDITPPAAITDLTVTGASGSPSSSPRK